MSRACANPACALTPADVFLAGRGLLAPFDLRLADGEQVRVEQILRLLPARRLVARVRRGGVDQLLKLYVRGADLARERRGLAMMHAAGLPAPRVLAQGERVLLLEFVPSATTLGEALAQAADDAARTALLRQALGLLQRLHDAGIDQRDPHPGNFLLGPAGMLLIDGASVRRLARPGRRRDALALFCCQFPLADRGPLMRALQGVPGAGARLPAAIRHHDRWRAGRLARKSTRECAEFLSESGWTRRLLVRRDRDSVALRALLRDPDAAIAAARMLKDGNTATVVRVECDGRALVLKRYNIRGWRHALSRCWRPSRAWHAWRNAARLRALGVATPPPVALIERRWGPLRGRAYLLCEEIPAPGIAAAPGDDAARAAMARGIALLFQALGVLGCRHGDCKASNFLFDGTRVWTLDLDGMRRVLPPLRRRALARDRARLLRSLDAGLARAIGAAPGVAA